MQAADEDAVMWDRHMTEAKEIMKVLQCFENDQADKKWTRMVRGLRRGLEGRIRARVGEEWKEAEEKQRDNSAFYGVRYKMWRPVEGVLGILVTLK